MKYASPGRKPKYDWETLINALKKFANQNPYKHIKISELARVTGIPRHIWKDNIKIKKVITEINNPPIIVSPENLNYTLPNAQQLVENNYSNKANLIKAVQDCLDVINDLYDKALVGINTEINNKKYIEQIAELKCTINEKDNEIRKLNNEIDLLYLDSESPTKRKSKGIKKNLIELNANNGKSISKNVNDLKEEYKGLFD